MDPETVEQKREAKRGGKKMWGGRNPTTPLVREKINKEGCEGNLGKSPTGTPDQGLIPQHWGFFRDCDSG